MHPVFLSLVFCDPINDFQIQVLQNKNIFAPLFEISGLFLLILNHVLQRLFDNLTI